MKSAEKQYLFSEKLLDGKTEQEASKEIKSFIDHEKAFKILYRENKVLKRKLERAEIKIQKYKQESFRNNLSKLRKEPKVKESKGVKEVRGSMFHLRRIINLMPKDIKYSKSKLGKELLIPGNEVELCFNFIIEYKIFPLEKTRDNYYIRT